MHFIDTKGRVFGIINILDLIVLLFFVSTVTGFFWLLNRGDFSRDFDPFKREYTEKEVEVGMQGISFATLTLIQLEHERIERTIERKEAVRPEHKDTFPLRILNITSLKSYRDEMRVSTEDALYDISLVLRLKANYDPFKGVFFYHGIPLLKGSALMLETEQLSVKTIIIEVKNE